jgi:S1-C subfamily serine protease
MLEFAWELTNPVPNAGFAVATQLQRWVDENAPELKAHFPFFGGYVLECHVSDILIIRIRFDPGLQLPTAGEMKADAVQRARAAPVPANYPEIRNSLGSDWFSTWVFTYVGPVQNNRACWPHVVAVLHAWVDDLVLPRALDLNARQIARAIPMPKPIDPRVALAAVWVLESELASEQHITQGTAFHLDGVGLVTAEHVLAEGMVAFKATDVNRRFAVRVQKKHEGLDLAVLSLETELGESLRAGDPNVLDQLHNITVVGFPNYRLGDTGVLVAGQVVGFRQRSGVRRILTNAPIVAGGSGGPVLNADGQVIGVAVTGSDMFRTNARTEDNSIIPIDALALIGA